MPIHQWPKTERPREKLLTHGSNALSDAELLAIFLRTGCAGKSALDLARELLNQFDGLRNLFTSNVEQFCAIKGMGQAKYAQLQAVLELAKRHLQSSLQATPIFKDSEQVRAYLKAHLRNETRETFCALFLTNQNQLISVQNLFYGSIRSAQIHPREVVKAALTCNAAAAIIAHNHPSGVAEPSRADIAITAELKQALALIEVELLDHFIVGEHKLTSLKECQYV